MSWKQHKKIYIKGWNYAGRTCPSDWTFTRIHKPTVELKEKLYAKANRAYCECLINTNNRVLQRRGKNIGSVPYYIHFPFAQFYVGRALPIIINPTAPNGRHPNI